MNQPISKQEIKLLCIEKLNNQISELKMLLNEVQNSSNQETKSTAGDKHDTARAQAQIEVERIGNQLLILESMLSDLTRLPTNEFQKIQLGGYVETNQGNFYVSVALGRIITSEHNFYAISTASPLGKLILGKSQKDEFEMPNRQKCTILQVY